MLGRASLLLVIFLCGAGAVARANRPEQAPPRSDFDRFPMALQEWRGQDLPPLDAKIMGLLGVDDYLNRIYARPDRTMTGLYVGYYKSQRSGDSIHSPQNCLPGAGWEPTASGYMAIPVAASMAASAPDQTIQVNRYLIQKGLDRQLVFYWYQSHGRV